ncbi:MAG: ADP-ribosylation/Crystallin J1 [Candidatus Riflebacteria bacterium]|nr:ADP-ribosylation/Crystallin J1 [Candidatus Riflebacteria bacterium]
MAANGNGDLYKELEVAIEAVRAAGAILLQDFHRPGGPRKKDDHHALADTEAERVIHDLLRGRFPQHGYLGEELGVADPGTSGFVWLVDPNDGTAAYLKGYRGSAVSIGLVHEGKPVLGVVFAFAAPTDEGDLFAWARGMPAVLRNGQPVPPRVWAAEPGPAVTVLCKENASERVVTWRRRVSPCRFRGVPGIAYRLALVAAGEGEACVSTSGPGGYDIAGGHALVAGMGGVMLTASGLPVSYDRHGSAHVGSPCTAGAPALAVWLLGRDWGHAGVQEIGQKSGPEKLAPGRNVADAGLLARAQGCLLGQLAGDALGELGEFKSGAQVKAEFPQGLRRIIDGGPWGTIAGQPTDDSELALMLARSLVAKKGFDLEAVARSYCHWLTSEPFDIGNTTRTGLGALKAALAAGGNLLQAVQTKGNRDSQANGALMRVSPLGIFGAGRDGPVEALEQMARQDAGLTHPHPVCADCSAVFVAALAHAIRTGAPAREVHGFACGRAAAIGVHPTVTAALEAAATAHGMPVLEASPRGFVLKAFQAAFYQLLHAPSLEDGLVAIVEAGGDTDTNGAIAGALLGSVHGVRAFPLQWLDRVLTCRPLYGLAGVERPRPPEFWPVDALTLAEHLLLAGAG